MSSPRTKRPASHLSDFFAWLLTLGGVVLCLLTLLNPCLVGAAETAPWAKPKTLSQVQLDTLLSQDRSLLANRLRDHRTQLARALAAWLNAPSESSAREWLGQLLDTIKRSSRTQRERIESLTTLSRLASQLPRLEASPCGVWKQGPYARQSLWVPRLLMQPGASGLRGALTDLLVTLPVSFSFPEVKNQKHSHHNLLDRSV
jgi:hypothetical protein